MPLIKCFQTQVLEADPEQSSPPPNPQPAFTPQPPLAEGGPAPPAPLPLAQLQVCPHQDRSCLAGCEVSDRVSVLLLLVEAPV